MASFLEEIWNSIFTPGTTPTLLFATNATFASLQAVLLALLLATWSVHFVVLSLLCGGLWYAINWFAAELAHQQTKEHEAREKAATIARQTADDSDETETEVEGMAAAGSGGGSSSRAKPQQEERKEEGQTKVELLPHPPPATNSSSKSPQTPHQSDDSAGLRQRTGVATSGTKSSVSTEDEWEKVSETEEKES
jgi:hypothetical protein